jgi:hypothetical protein
MSFALPFMGGTRLVALERQPSLEDDRCPDDPGVRALFDGTSRHDRQDHRRSDRPHLHPTDRLPLGPGREAEAKPNPVEMPPLSETLAGIIYGYVGDTVPVSMIAEINEWMRSTEVLLDALNFIKEKP